MYLKRKIDDFLMNWKKKENKLPLIIKGPRQIGKTKSILNFAEKSYANYIYINFLEEPQYKKILDDGLKVKNIINLISLIDPFKTFIPKNTLIIFDEIQDFIEITSSLKFFKLDDRFDVICSGSLLGINYNRIDSISVGYKLDYEMYSLDFEEFLWAKGYENKIADMFNKMINFVPFNDLEFSVYNKLFLEYTVLGGMPNVILNYILKESFEDSLSLQRQIILDYKEDIKKYASGIDKTKIIDVFNHIPNQLAKENKKFQLAQIEKNARFNNYRGVIEWLNEAGLINLCFNMNYLDIPLKANYDERNFKIYYKDTGLLISMLDKETSEDLRVNKNLGVYKGAIYESLVAEAFVKSGLDLYFYKNTKSTLEIDFILRNVKNIIPIEVKSNDGNSKSLKTIVKNNELIDFGIKLCNKNIGKNDVFITFPYFLSFKIKDFLEKYINY